MSGRGKGYVDSATFDYGCLPGYRVFFRSCLDKFQKVIYLRTAPGKFWGVGSALFDRHRATVASLAANMGITVLDNDRHWEALTPWRRQMDNFHFHAAATETSNPEAHDW